MSWDGPLVAALARELRTRLRGERLKGHEFRWDQREIVLYFRSCTLRWALHPGQGWVTLDGPGEPPPEARSLSAQVTEVSAEPDERVLEMSLRRARGRVRSIRVVFELMTNQWNALLLEGAEERIRHLLWTRNLEERPLVVGRRYQRPEASNRQGIREPLSEGDWKALTHGKGPEEARQILLEEVAFTSTINLPGLLSGPEEDSLSLGGHVLWRRLRDLESPQFCVLESTRGLQPYPYIIYGFDYSLFPDILSAIRAGSEGASPSSEASEALHQDLVRELRRAQRRVGGLQKELASAKDPAEPRALANLILARLSQIPHGAGTVTLEGFYGETVEVPLEPTRSPQENAEALYDEAARRERARERLPGLMKEAEMRVHELEGLVEGLQTGEADPQEVRSRLPRAPERTPGRKQGDRLPYRTFRSSGGLEIRVGRGSRDNDALTFRHAAPMDVWLHARDASGAHVVLRWEKEDPPPNRDLMEAAILAALHSGSRGAGMVPVDWTRRKHVRKARKAPPGTVLPRHIRTLFVEPDPGLPGRLRGGDGP